MATETVNVNATAITAAIAAEAAARVAGDAASVATAASDATAKANAAQAVAIGTAATDATTKANAAQSAAISAASTDATTKANAAQAAAIAASAQRASNLSDLASVATARTNLGIFTPVFKTVDESKISNVALAADSALKFTMSANKVYAFRCVVIFETTGLADIKFRHAGPASPTRVRIARDSIISAGSVYGNVFVDTAYSAADINISGTVDGSGLFRCEGTISNGANVGDFQLLWAQRSSDANNTTVLAGSYLEWRQV